MNDLNVRALRSSLLGTIALAALLFIPAGTLNYWQAWAFMAVFVGASSVVTVYLAINDRKLLERRMDTGPMAEKQRTQKIVMSFAMAGFVALIVVPALDHRFVWSSVPAYVAASGDVLVALGFLFVYLVLKVNTFAASTIQMAEGQTVISTGPYALVRHPMYAGVLPLLIGTPLALGSWWGLFALFVVIPALVWRLLDEEKFLAMNLPDYVAYEAKVRNRLIPFVW
jgi:protein-S-isoprenylcysteine O-methyltransferase Ste14